MAVYQYSFAEMLVWFGTLKHIAVLNTVLLFCFAILHCLGHICHDITDGVSYCDAA